MKFAVITPWYNPEQLDHFVNAWGIQLQKLPPWLFLERDAKREGTARTKNRGIRRAIDAGAEVCLVLDDDCFPKAAEPTSFNPPMTLEDLAHSHIYALAPQPVQRFTQVTNPPSRGTPYFARTTTMEVAASMGFWEEIPDRDAVSQLSHGATAKMKFRPQVIYGQYFPLSGMNMAFRSSEWPWCQFINVPRFDDIWQGFLWQKKAYAERKCFALTAATVRHSRQSNVWENLKQEAANLQRNETIWAEIEAGPLLPYEEMLKRYGLSV